MIATLNQQVSKDSLPLTHEEMSSFNHEKIDTAHKFKNLKASQFVLPAKVIRHHPKAGLNPLVDTASYLFSIMGSIKTAANCRPLDKLHDELISEINQFHEALKNHGYNTEYVLVSRYVICATMDDLVSNTAWGNGSAWDNYALLPVFNQDTGHDKFFEIMERAIKEPALYIDLMELIYICLSMGYKGKYRQSEKSLDELEQITTNLYKHIRAYRGSFNKSLSPIPFKAKSKVEPSTPKSPPSLLFIFCVTACIIMSIFIALSYLTDLISNEAYNNIKAPVAEESAQ